MAFEGNSGTEDILQAALSQAFSPPPSDRHEHVDTTKGQPESSLNDPAELPAEPLGESFVSSGSLEDSWKAEYEAQVETWRTQSSEAREKAQRERERWESIRAAEREEAERRKAMGIVDEPEPTAELSESEREHDASWETVSSHRPESEHLAESSIAPSERAVSPKPPADHKEYITPVLTASVPSAEITRTHSHADTGDDSQKWEDIQSESITSFPSMSYPEHTQTPSPSRQEPPPAPLNATIAIFDSSLSTRTRVTALFSSLAINMLLPFVNGVMLGFGEIFAKNVVMDWFGWRPAAPGHVAASAGLSASRPKTPWGQREPVRS